MNWRRGWPHVRAAFVAAHILAVLILAIPDAAGPAARRSAWKNPTVQGEFDAWSRRLTALGVATSRDELEERVWVAATTWTRFTLALRRPLVPYGDCCGVRQRWRMFVAPQRHPSRLHVDLFEDGRWRPIWIERSGEYDWRAHQFDATRVRSMTFRYAWKEYERHYVQFGRWIAARAAEDFPAATKVRVRLYDFRTPTPEEVQRDAIPRGKFRQRITFELEEFR